MATGKKPAPARGAMKDLKPLPRKNGAETASKPAAKNLEKPLTKASMNAIKKGLANAAAKTASKKPSAMGQSAKSQQKDFAKISGTIAGAKKFAADKANGLKDKENKPSPSFTAAKKAEKKTLKSFGKSK